MYSLYKSIAVKNTAIVFIAHKCVSVQYVVSFIAYSSLKQLWKTCQMTRGAAATFIRVHYTPTNERSDATFHKQREVMRGVK